MKLLGIWEGDTLMHGTVGFPNWVLMMWYERLFLEKMMEAA